MMASEVRQEVSQCQKHSHNLQATDVPRKIMPSPQTFGKVALHDRSPVRNGCVHIQNFSLTWYS